MTRDGVVDLRRRYARGATLDALATAFGIARSTARHIARGHGWKHVPFDAPILQTTNPQPIVLYISDREPQPFNVMAYHFLAFDFQSGQRLGGKAQ